MKRLAITGGIACGKSLCGHFLKVLGCAVCDTDQLGHALLTQGQPGFDRVIKQFGSDIIDTKGNIDRHTLGRRVFHDAEALQRLNDLMHPLILDRLRQWLHQQEGAECQVVAVQIPLLFELGLPRDDWDHVLCVMASEATCRRRLQQRGWSATDINARRRAQWPMDTKQTLADIVFHNDGTPAWLQRQIKVAWPGISSRIT